MYGRASVSKKASCTIPYAAAHRPPAKHMALPSFACGLGVDILFGNGSDCIVLCNATAALLEGKQDRSCILTLH